jgi:23S rRNA (uridine2552-2'-O)-methyltransferase
MEPIEDVDFFLGDFRDEAVLAQLEARLADLVAAAPDGRVVDLVLSDMAPNLSGVALADAARMQHVIELAADFAVRFLKPRGALLVKAFHGSGYSQIVEALKRDFSTVLPRKPKASRDRSSETFILARGLKRLPP